jgi:hypothetical protein
MQRYYAPGRREFEGGEVELLTREFAAKQWLEENDDE